MIRSISERFLLTASFDAYSKWLLSTSVKPCCATKDREKEREGSVCFEGWHRYAGQHCCCQSCRHHLCDSLLIQHTFQMLAELVRRRWYVKQKIRDFFVFFHHIAFAWSAVNNGFFLQDGIDPVNTWLKGVFTFRHSKYCPSVFQNGRCCCLRSQLSSAGPRLLQKKTPHCKKYHFLLTLYFTLNPHFFFLKPSETTCLWTSSHFNITSFSWHRLSNVPSGTYFTMRHLEGVSASFWEAIFKKINTTK